MQVYDRDQEHLNLLGIFHYVMAGFNSIVCLCGSLYLIIGVLVVSGAIPEAKGQEDAQIVGTVFLVIGLVFAIVGLASVMLLFLAGLWLRAVKHRTFCFVIAVINLMWFPFGTTLGIFTIVVLTRQSVVDRFAGREPAVESLQQEEETALAGNDL